MFKHLYYWNRWRKNCFNNSKHKFLVLLGIRKSPTLEQIKELDRIRKPFKKGYKKGVESWQNNH